MGSDVLGSNTQGSVALRSVITEVDFFFLKRVTVLDVGARGGGRGTRGLGVGEGVTS